MRYRLRTLLIFVLLMPPLLAIAWSAWPRLQKAYEDWQWQEATEAAGEVAVHCVGIVTEDQ